jgi:membrane associated rhomboid family serine protease
MPTNTYFTATNFLIALCVCIFISEKLFGDSISASFGMSYIESPLFRPVQVLSHIFLHGGLTHLLLNMLGLWIFGKSIERVFGVWRFIGFYMVCGVGAACLYQTVAYIQFQNAIAPLLAGGVTYQEAVSLFSGHRYFAAFPSSEQASIVFSTSMVGASGALYGILVAFMYLFPNHKMILLLLPFPIAAKYFVPILLSIDLLSGITGFSLFGSQIAHSAHIGGAITGLLFMLLLVPKAKTVDE